jgi:hypothetical protein
MSQVGIGTPPPPLPQACAPLPGTHSPANEGVGESHFQRLEKKLSTLSTLTILMAISVSWCVGLNVEHARNILYCREGKGCALVKVISQKPALITLSTYNACMRNRKIVKKDEQCT